MLEDYKIMEHHISESAVSVSGVCKFFYTAKGILKALDGISFSASKGEILGIVGPNGAGKTTLLRIISGLITPTSGKVSLFGKDNCVYAEENKLRIGFLSGDTALYERLTGLEVLTFAAELYGMTKTEALKRAEYFAELLNFNGIEKRICKNLSAGEKQKISIVRAMIHDPDLLILDEATNGLDILAGNHILWLVKEAKKQGKTVLYSAHNMDEIEKLSDRLLFLFSGRLIESGTVDEIRSKHEGKDLTECFMDIINYENKLKKN